MTAPQNILLTGLPGCGKTTLVRRVVDRLVDLRISGLVTQELRGADGRRVGFEALGVNGGRATLAHVRSKSKIRVGRYGVELRDFEKLVDAELGGDNGFDLLVVDEIGKMQCHSRRFVELIQQLLDSETPVLATVALRDSGRVRVARTCSGRGGVFAAEKRRKDATPMCNTL